MIIEESNSSSSIQKIKRAQDTMIDYDVMLYFIFSIEWYKQRQHDDHRINEFHFHNTELNLFIFQVWWNLYNIEKQNICTRKKMKELRSIFLSWQS
jgi:hypothetical protein